MIISTSLLRSEVKGYVSWWYADAHEMDYKVSRYGIQRYEKRYGIEKYTLEVTKIMT